MPSRCFGPEPSFAYHAPTANVCTRDSARVQIPVSWRRLDQRGFEYGVVDREPRARALPDGAVVAADAEAIGPHGPGAVEEHAAYAAPWERGPDHLGAGVADAAAFDRAVGLGPVVEVALKPGVTESAMVSTIASWNASFALFL